MNHTNKYGSYIGLGCACLAFCVFWGNNTVSFSELLTCSGFQAMFQMVCRAAFLCGIAYSVYRFRRLSKVLAFLALAIQTAVSLVVIAVPQVNLDHSWLMLALYSFYMDFFLIAFILYFYSWGRSWAPKITVISFCGSYVVSTVFYTVQVASHVRFLASLVAAVVIIALLLRRDLFNEQSFTDSSLDKSAETSSRFSQLLSLKMPFGPYASWGFFGSSIILLLIVFQIWFQISHINPAANFEYQTPLYGLLAIVALISYYFVYRIQSGRAIELFPIVSLVVFLVTQIAVLIFWQQAALVMSIMTGMWFAVYQYLLFLWGQGFSSQDKPVLHQTVRYALGMGLTYCALAVGNLIARLVFGVEPISYGTLSTLSFAFMLLIVLALLGQLLLYVRRNMTSSGSASVRSADRGTENPLELLCATYKITPREKDVLELYLNGRTAGWISEQLFLSESTVKTYIRRVYTKCDVHSREGLLDLLEELEEYSESNACVKE